MSTFSSLALIVLPHRLAVCRLPLEASTPEWARLGDLLSITWAQDELSIVAEERYVPPEVKAERGWRAIKVQGPLDFALTGILASLATPLAEAGISIFAISTFHTDYLLVRESQLERATDALQLAGHVITAGE